MYLSNAKIRELTFFVGHNRTIVLNWMKGAKQSLDKKLDENASSCHEKIVKK